jgi:putative heme-binding domain-containing protein
LTTDPDDRVRLQAALALAGWTNVHSREPVLQRLLANETNRWLRLAAASGLAELPNDLLTSLRPVGSMRPPAPQPRGVDPDRQAVVERSQGALALRGDSRKGAVTATRLCLPCHYLLGQGQRIGPDLSGLSGRPVEALLVDLIDPGRQVAPEYVVHEVTTKSGDPLVGLIASESANRLVMRYAGAPDHTIPRSEVREIRATGRSLMPDGLEEGLSLQDIADLLAFLRKPEL